MSKISIDTVKLAEQIEVIKKSKRDLEEIFGLIKDDNFKLRDMWETRTSESVFESFDDFYKSLQSNINNLSADIAFLEKVVNAGYIEYEEVTNEKIDDKVAL